MHSFYKLAFSIASIGFFHSLCRLFKACAGLCIRVDILDFQQVKAKGFPATTMSKEWVRWKSNGEWQLWLKETDSKGWETWYLGFSLPGLQGRQVVQFGKVARVHC